MLAAGRTPGPVGPAADDRIEAGHGRQRHGPAGHTATAPTAQLVRVCCTAYSDYSEEELAARLGATDQLLILNKPFDPVEVRRLARALTEKWTLRQLTRVQTSELERRAARRASVPENGNGTTFVRGREDGGDRVEVGDAQGSGHHDPGRVRADEDASIEEAAWALTRRNIGGAPVRDDRGKLVGFLSRSDLVNPSWGDWVSPKQAVVGDVMNPRVTCAP